ncbi:MAG: hypothetical protein ACJ71Y_03915 [Blastococcus sp.]|jgi:hypothetical protein
MAVITVTAQTPLQTVLHVVEGATATTRILRTDANGTIALRVPAGTFPLPPGSTTDLVDYEYSMVAGTEVAWTAYNAAGAANGSLKHVANTARGAAVLTCPLLPDLGQVLTDPADPSPGSVVTVFDSTRDGLSTLHQVVGRDDPIITPRPSAFPVGTLQIVCPSLAEARGLAAMLSRGYIWMLRQSDQLNLDFYLVVTATRLEHSELNWTQSPRPERRWTVSASYAQIAAPGPDVTPLVGWTYATVPVSYRTYAELLGPFATYADLLTRHTT